MKTQEETATGLLESLDIPETCQKLWIHGVEFTRNNSGLFDVTDKIDLV